MGNGCHLCLIVVPNAGMNGICAYPHGGGGPSNGPCADSLPLSDHFRRMGGGLLGGGGLPRKRGRGAGKIRIGGAHEWAEMLHHPCILWYIQTKGDKIRIGCLTPTFREAHKGAAPCILGHPRQRGQSQSQKKQKKNIPHWGLNQGSCSCTSTGLPPRVWAICDTPLHRGGIHIWSHLVFIHKWVLLRKN